VPYADRSEAVSADKNPRGQAERVLELVQVLSLERKLTKRRIYEILDVTSQSSFKRYKAALAEAGLPLHYDSDDKHYHLAPGAAIARFDIDPRDRAKFAQIRADIAALGRPTAEQFDGLLNVLDARFELGDPNAEAVISARHPQPSGGPAFYAALDRALTAVREHRFLSFDYASTVGGANERRTLAPYAVHAHEARYYVWGVTEGEAQPKLFALDRARDVALEDDTFEPDPGLSLADELRTSFGVMTGTLVQRVVVRFSPSVAAYAACRRWPAQVEARPQPDGSLDVTFMLSRFEEIVAWVLGFGGTATILEPPKARAELHVAASRALAVSE